MLTYLSLCHLSLGLYCKLKRRVKSYLGSLLKQIMMEGRRNQSKEGSCKGRRDEGIHNVIRK